MLYEFQNMDLEFSSRYSKRYPPVPKTPSNRCLSVDRIWQRCVNIYLKVAKHSPERIYKLRSCLLLQNEHFPSSSKVFCCKRASPMVATDSIGGTPTHGVQADSPLTGIFIVCNFVVFLLSFLFKVIRRTKRIMKTLSPKLKPT